MEKRKVTPTKLVGTLQQKFLGGRLPTTALLLFLLTPLFILFQTKESVFQKSRS